jgi:hypothetical protein
MSMQKNQKAGTWLFSIGATGFLLNLLIPALIAKAERNGPQVMTVPGSTAVSRDGLSGPGPSGIKGVKMGEWSDWVYVMGLKVYILPGNAKVEYQVKDVNGNIRNERTPAVWNDAVYERFRSLDVDIAYTVRSM